MTNQQPLGVGGFSDSQRELLRRIERDGSPQGLSGMTNRELAEWLVTCSVMTSRVALANSARRQWKRLLKDAHEERAERERQQRAKIKPRDA